MKKYLLDVFGGIVGLVGYRAFFWGIPYKAEVFFYPAILALICYGLYKLDRLANNKKSDPWTSFIISCVIGVIASYIYLNG